MYYGKLLRQIVEGLRGFSDLPTRLSHIGENINKHAETIRTAHEGDEQQKKIGQEWADEILAEYKKSEGKKTASDNRQYSVQNSLRWATWLAFGAAAIYAAIAAKQLQKMDATYREIQQQTAASQKAACAAKSSADTAANSLIEYKRQFDQMFPLSSRQAAAAEASVQQQRAATEAQSEPYLVIEIKGVSAKTIDRGPPSDGVSRQQWEKMNPRSVDISYIVKNKGMGDATNYTSDFIFDIPEHGIFEPTKGWACGKEMSRVKFGLQPLLSLQESPILKSTSELQLTYGKNFLHAVGCVAYLGRKDSMDSPHLYAVEAAIAVGDNQSGKQPIATISPIRPVDLSK